MLQITEVARLGAVESTNNAAASRRGETMAFNRFLVLGLLLAQMPTLALAKKPNRDRGAVTFQVLPDPGFEAPALDTPEYSRFTLGAAGDGTISGHVRLVLDSGEVVRCSPQTEVLLYPDTRYTEWMLARWADDVNGKNFAIAPYPVYDRRMKVPAWFTPSKAAADHVVRVAGCSYASGFFQFRNVPPGRYDVVTSVTRFGGKSAPQQGGSTLVQTDTPSGPQMSIVVGGPTVAGGPGPSDAYILIGKFPVIVNPGGTFTFAPEDLKIISHAYESP